MGYIVEKEGGITTVGELVKSLVTNIEGGKVKNPRLSILWKWIDLFDQDFDQVFGRFGKPRS